MYFVALVAGKYPTFSGNRIRYHIMGKVTNYIVTTQVS